MSFAIEIAKRTLWMEARGEPEEGQYAIAHVLDNRVKSGRWGPNLVSVCLAPFQFSCWNTSDPNRHSMALVLEDDKLLSKMMIYIIQAQNNNDPTKGATHYYNPHVVKEPPAWTVGATLTADTGNHLFYKDVK